MEMHGPAKAKIIEKKKKPTKVKDSCYLSSRFIKPQ
jgi:hypothetical protein